MRSSRLGGEHGPIWDVGIVTNTNPPDWDLRSAELAKDAIAAGEPTAWFDQLYSEGTSGRIALPWDRGAPLPPVVDYFEVHPLEPGTRAVVVGCGLGVDSEYLGELSRNVADSSVIAFDISSTAISVVRSRYQHSSVDCRVADLFALPAEWSAGFDVVVEIINVQALPVALRTQAAQQIATLVAPGGRLVVVENVRDAAEPLATRPPWAFTLEDIDLFLGSHLHRTLAEKHPMATTGPEATRSRWLVEFTRHPR